MADPLVLHQQLLAELAEASDEAVYPSSHAAVDTLRAVVELHRPHSIGLTAITDGQDVPLCHACSFHRFGAPFIQIGWLDCLTVRKVAEGLGVHLD